MKMSLSGVRAPIGFADMSGYLGHGLKAQNLAASAYGFITNPLDVFSLSSVWDGVKGLTLGVSDDTALGNIAEGFHESFLKSVGVFLKGIDSIPPGIKNFFKNTIYVSWLLGVKDLAAGIYN